MFATSSPTEECPNAKRAFNEDGWVVRLACDQWLCPYCRKILAWRWAQRVRYGIALRLDTEPWFWTLTLPGWVPTREKGYAILPERWDNFRKALQRSYPDFTYAAFVEGQPERGLMPHFHIITFQPAPGRLKDLAVHSGFGHQADQQEVTGGYAAWYVSKYASKSTPGIPGHFRRVRISRDWPSLPAPEYPLKVYPLLPRETLPMYFHRMSVTLGSRLELVRDAWLDRSRDIH